VVLAKVEPFFGLSNSEIVHGVLFALESVTGLLEEDDGLLKVLVLGAG